MDYDIEIAKLMEDQANTAGQICELKKEVRDLRKLTVAVESIAATLKPMDDRIKSIDSRLNTIEREPAESFKYYKRTLVGCVLTGIIGAILGAVLALII